MAYARALELEAAAGVYIHLFMYVSLSIYMYIYIYLYIFIYVYIYMYINKCVCVCARARDDMTICLPPQGTPPQDSSRHGSQCTQHTASTAATPRYPWVEDKPPQTCRPHSTGLCSPLLERPDSGSAQRHVHARA